jgi:hypothetical protein
MAVHNRHHGTQRSTTGRSGLRQEPRNDHQSHISSCDGVRRIGCDTRAHGAGQPWVLFQNGKQARHHMGAGGSTPRPDPGTTSAPSSRRRSGLTRPPTRNRRFVDAGTKDHCPYGQCAGTLCGGDSTMATHHGTRGNNRADGEATKPSQPMAAGRPGPRQRLKACGEIALLAISRDESAHRSRLLARACGTRRWRRRCGGAIVRRWRWRRS